MKRIWWIILVAPLFLQFQDRRGDFAGTWDLDVKKSVNLPPSFASVEAYVLVITQSGDSLTVVATMKGKGQTVPFPPYVYIVNGRETYRKDTLRGSERWMTAKWGKDGKSVITDTRVSMKQAGKPSMEFTQHDEWKIAGGGSMDVTITQRMTGVDSVRTEHRVFRKR